MTHHLQYYIFIFILTISDPTLSRGPGVGRIHYVRTSDHCTSLSDSLSSNLHDFIQPLFSLLFEIHEVIYAPNLWRVFNIPVVYPSQSPYKIFLQFQMTVVELVYW